MAYVAQVRGGFKVRWREGGRGSPLLASTVFAEEPKARDFADDIATRLAAKRTIARSKRHGAPIEINELVRRWAASRIAERKITGAYGDRVAKLLRAMAKELDWTTVVDITPAEVDRWRTEQGGRNARLGAMLRSVLRFAAERLQQPVPDGSWLALRPPRPPRRPRADLPAAKLLSRWQSLADAISANAGSLVHCLATYGWRPISAARLVAADIDLAGARVTLRNLKGGGDIRHPILPETVKRLRPLLEQRGATDRIFLDPRTDPAKPWNYGSDGSPITDWWRVQIDRTRGIYDLKRHAISTMLDRGLAPQDVALFTGHRSLSQVLTYARSNDERALVALQIIGRRTVAPRAHRGRSAAISGTSGRRKSR